MSPLPYDSTHLDGLQNRLIEISPLLIPSLEKTPEWQRLLLQVLAGELLKVEVSFEGSLTRFKVDVIKRKDVA